MAIFAGLFQLQFVDEVWQLFRLLGESPSKLNRDKLMDFFNTFEFVSPTCLSAH